MTMNHPWPGVNLPVGKLCCGNGNRCPSQSPATRDVLGHDVGCAPYTLVMGTVTVSAARLSSMLGNRHQTPADIAPLALSVDPSQCAQADSDLTLEDLMALGKFFKRPWSYLLIDEPEASIPSGKTIGRSEIGSDRPHLPCLIRFTPRSKCWPPPQICSQKRSSKSPLVSPLRPRQRRRVGLFVSSLG